MPRPGTSGAPIQIMSAPNMRRSFRRPQHPFNLVTLPFAIQPFFIAPVFPGETLKNLLLQARVVTDPINNPLIGWWCEFYFFYCKLRDLDLRDEFSSMLLNPTYNTSTITTDLGTTANVSRYFAGGAGMIDYVEACRRRCVNEYFRDEGDTYSSFTVTDGAVTHSLAQVVGNNVLDSVFDVGDETAQDVTLIDAGGADVLTMSELDAAQRLWELQRMNGLTEMSFEDYIASFGIRPSAVELHRPELVRYVRGWQYPSNTIDPTNGTPRSAVSWSIAERADKDRFFREPGFMFGLHVVRPKVYVSNQTGTFTSAMNNAMTWIPAILSGDPRVSRKQVADNVGPLGTINADANGYWFDVRDLGMYGEQFLNFSLSGNNNNLLPLPIATLVNKRYPTALDDIRNFFVDEAGASGKYYARSDGIVSLNIASTMKDMSPRSGTPAEA